MLVGDFNPETAHRLAEQYFSRIPRGPREAPDVVTLEVPQRAEKRMYAEAETNPQVDILWHTVAFGHRDSYALSILAQVLSGRTGRLYKGLVLGSQIATDVGAQPNSQKWAGYFNVSGEAKDGHTPEQVEQGIYAELEKLKQEEVPAEELQKVKNNFAAAEFRKLTSNTAILFQLILNTGMGDWREINAAGPKYQAVTAADVKRVAAKYLTRENRTVAIYTRKAAPGAAEDPDLAGLNAEQQSAVRQMTGQLTATTDVAKLRAGLGRMESALSDAPPEMIPVLRIAIKKTQSRIAELGNSKN
jgi:predicted Zn-dependent peptidase